MVAHYEKPIITKHMSPPASHFIGRQHELKMLWSQYEVARGGCTRVALLVGELGIGKTRLMDEFATHARKDGAIVLIGGGSESEGMPPYLPFLEALGQHVRNAPLDTLLEQIVVAPQILASILPELAARVGEVPVASPSLPEQTRLRLYEAIGMFLEAISQPHGLVLILDDLHWADTASLDLLCYITRHHSRAKLLILGAYREGEVNRNPAIERAVTELARQRILTKIVVEPLSSEQSGELAASYLEGTLSPMLSKLLYTQSEGNPFFAEELTQGWIEMGALVQEGRHWVAIASLEQTLPESIVGALRQRFARLPSQIISHLRVAAIIGRTFDLSLLALIEGQEIEVIEERLIESERARLVKMDQTGVFRFSHDKIRECLYNEVSSSRRQRLHEAIGHALEARYEREPRKSIYQLAELAFHFTHGGDRIRGATYSQLAAEQALRSSASKEAMTYYQTALSLLPQDDRRRGLLLLGLGEAALLEGSVKEAIVSYEAALQWLLRSGDLKMAAQAAHSLGLARWRQESFQLAQTSFEQALALLGKKANTEVAKVQLDLALLLTAYMGQPAEGLAYAKHATEIARLLKEKSLEVAGLRIVAINHCVSGNDIATAIQLLEQALSLAEEIDDACQGVECCLYLMILLYWKAEMRRSEEVTSRAMQFIQHCQHQHQLPSIYCWQALFLASQGVWTEAELKLGQASQLFDYESATTALAFFHHIRGFLAYQRDDYATAEEEFLAAKEHQHNGLENLLCCTHMLGIIQIALGKREEAYLTLAELETALAEQPPDSLSTASIATCLALMALALEDQERVAKLYLKLLQFQGHYCGFLVDRVLGEMAAFCRDWELATKHLSAAEATAQKQDLRPELARIRAKQGNLEMIYKGQGGDQEAKELLSNSLALFEDMNMLESANRVHRQMRTLLQRQDYAVPRSLPADLTTREATVLQLVAEGKSNRQIAQELRISEKTVANHLSHIFNKTTSDNRAAAAAFAIRHGLA